MTDIASSTLFTNLYLYGQVQTPVALTDRLRDIPPEDTISVTIDIQSYMSSNMGRYTVAARSSFVQDFFSGNVVLDPGSYTVASLVSLYGEGAFKFSYQQAQVDVGNNLYMERAYVFGHEAFDLGVGAIFVVEADGSKRIDNLTVIPQGDNFDFESSPLVNIYNNTLLVPEIDPFGIGRKVDIIYTGTTAPVTYTAQDYIVDIGHVQQWDVSQAAAGAAILELTPDLLAHLRADGAIEYERDGKKIIYDGQQTNSISVIDLMGAGVGAIVVAGAGDDAIVGGDEADIFYGGAGNDNFKGGEGSDEFWGNEEGDESSVPGETDTADYSEASAPISIVYNNSSSAPSLSVNDGSGGTDKLHSIEIIKGTLSRDTLTINGSIRADTQLTIDANGGQSPNAHDTINTKNVFGHVDIHIDSAGNGHVTTADTGGTINLVGFHTGIVGSSSSNTITDLSSGTKQITGGSGDDTITVGGAGGMVKGNGGSDVLQGGDGAVSLTRTGLYMMRFGL